jgi:hypothetical protein
VVGSGCVGSAGGRGLRLIERVDDFVGVAPDLESGDEDFGCCNDFAFAVFVAGLMAAKAVYAYYCFVHGRMNGVFDVCVSGQNA